MTGATGRGVGQAEGGGDALEGVTFAAIHAAVAEREPQKGFEQALHFFRTAGMQGAEALDLGLETYASVPRP